MVKTRRTALLEEVGDDAPESKRPKHTDTETKDDNLDSDADKEEEDGKGVEVQAIASTESTSNRARSILTRHVDVGKPFILDSLTMKTVKETWDRLSGTEWCQDPDICCKALKCGLDPSEFQGMDCLFKNPKRLAALLTSAKSNAQAKEIWKMIERPMRNKMIVSFAARNRNVISLQEMPKRFTSEKSLKKGIRMGWLQWRRLPLKCRKDVEFALCALSKGMGGFWEAEKEVEDKVKLWREWACEDPYRVSKYQNRNVFGWNEAPQEVLSDQELMWKVTEMAEGVVSYVHESLMSDLFFLTTMLELNILSLAYLPESSLSKFPSLMSLDRINEYIHTNTVNVFQQYMLRGIRLPETLSGGEHAQTCQTPAASLALFRQH